jgi:hypothetical protein
LGILEEEDAHTPQQFHGIHIIQWGLITRQGDNVKKAAIVIIKSGYKWDSLFTDQSKVDSVSSNDTVNDKQLAECASRTLRIETYARIHP